MKNILPLIALTLFASVLAAQEEVPRAEAVKFAAVVNFDLEKLADTPIPTDADVKRPFGIKADKRGGLVVPEAKLSPATFSTAGKDVVPVGQLWLAGLALAKDVLSLPLNKISREQKWPLEFTAEREGNASARVTLSLVGKYEASFLLSATFALCPSIVKASG